MTADDHLSLDPVALAIEEQLLAEWQAGKRPRLSVYAARYPAYASVLAELVASLPPDASDLTNLTDTPDIQDIEASPEAHLESFPERLWTGTGANRALASIFGEVQFRRSANQLGHVAEERQGYNAGRADGAPDRYAGTETTDE